MSPTLARFLRTGSGPTGLLLVAVVAGAALAAPLIAPGDPLSLAGRPLLWPFQDARHPLGTDMLGRDLLAGLVHGARSSLLVGFGTTALAVLIGIAVGAVGGYARGRADDALMRLTDAFQTVPGFVLALALVAVLGASLGSTIIAVTLVSWTGIARVVRAEYLSLREREFVQAYRSIGMGAPEIVVRHLLPNALGPVVVLGTMLVANAILIESALAFLGLGDPNLASWGGIIGAGRNVLRTAWYVPALPGIAIAVTVLGVSLLGEGLAEALDPKGRRT